jgi:two-component sensor histidine kinase
VTHWEEEHANLDELLKKRGLASVGEADRAEWLAIQDFQHRVSDMLAWVADVLMPQGTELRAEAIDAAIDLLQQRALTLGSSGHHSFAPLTRRYGNTSWIPF